MDPISTFIKNKYTVPPLHLVSGGNLWGPCRHYQSLSTRKTLAGAFSVIVKSSRNFGKPSFPALMGEEMEVEKQSPGQHDAGYNQ